MNSLPHIRSITPYLYRIPLETPVVTSFGTMRARSALFIAIDDTEGHRGWGEVWCNFPDSGALHRYRLLHEVFVPLMVNQPTAHPVRLMADVKMKTRILRLQTAEYGPLDQCAAGLDCALWDLYARQHGQPLYQVLGGTGSRMPVYASGINPSGVQETIALAQQAGHTAFKVKVGFGEDVDRHTLQVAREVVGDHFLAADANQAWSIDTALHMGDMLDAFELQWLEEPIAADSADSDWQRLCQALRTPLAAGENMNRLSDFERATRTWGLQYATRSRQMGGYFRVHAGGGDVQKTGHHLLPPLSWRRHRFNGLGPLVSGLEPKWLAGNGRESQPASQRSPGRTPASPRWARHLEFGTRSGL